MTDRPQLRTWTVPVWVECDACGKQVRLRKDGSYGAHGYTRHGLSISCDNAGKPYAWHTGEFSIVTRNPNVWMAQCRCGESWLGDTYDAVSDLWGKHYSQQTWPELGAS